MASKKTKRERKEQARKQRLEAQRRAARRRQLRKVYSLATAAAVVALVVGLIMLSGRGARRAVGLVNTRAAAAGCADMRGVLEPGSNHVGEGAINYSTNPPTSGNHRPVWYDTGVYTEPLENEQQVHNLEHGHIVVQYKDLPEDTVTALAGVTAEEDNRAWMILAPKPDMEHAMALTAWGRIVTCEAAPSTEEAVALASQFAETFRDKSPRESVPGNPRGGTPPPQGHGGTPSPGGS